MDFIFDFGNARGKWFDPRTNEYGDFRHAIVELSEGQWRDVAGRGKPPEGIVKVNGVGYAIGDVARRYTIPARPKGASRYQRQYYGVALAYAASEAFKRSVKKIQLFASHAPGDIGYARNLRQSAEGVWQVESRYGCLDFQIKDVVTFDEPLGGYSHYVFTEKGMERRKNPLAEVTTLVVDVGGYTCDVIAVDPGGNIDLLSAGSTRTGVIQLTESFERDLRANNLTMFQNAGDLDIRRVENAVLSGAYRFGKVTLECHQEATAAINALVNEVIQVIREAGGEENYDVMLLSGGGAALIYAALSIALPRVEFLLAEGNSALMKYANVFGGAKIAAMLRLEGQL